MTIPRSWPHPTRRPCVRTPSQARYHQGAGDFGLLPGLTGVPSLPRPRVGLTSVPCPLLTLQLIQTISVVDRDEPQGGHRFYFRLVPEAPSNPHFSLLDIQGELSLNPQIVGCLEGGA